MRCAAALSPIRIKCLSRPLRCFHMALRASPDQAAGLAASPDIARLAKLAQIGLTEQEVRAPSGMARSKQASQRTPLLLQAADAEPKLRSILEWFGQLQAVDVSGVPPAIHGGSQGTLLRPDLPQPSQGREELLALAPATQGHFIRVPKIATAADDDASRGTRGAAASPPPASTTSTAPQDPAASHTSTVAADPAAPSTPAPAAGPAAAAAAGPGGGGGGGGEGSSPTAGAREAARQLDFRVGRIVSCHLHPDADSLYVEQIDIGEAEPRTIVSGLVKYVPLELMQGRMVVVIANLKPRNMRGVKSAGMVLAASDDPKTTVVPLTPPPGAAVGERLWLGDERDQPAPAAPNAVEKKKLWEQVVPGLRTDSRGVATWHGLPLQTSLGPATAVPLPSCRIA
ncbi:hypothetical protein QJQ45_026116 [Haematococcus lacustris]|nr:hypothetical protein QJQ45_026116 [Haematococcus lacustris]